MLKGVNHVANKGNLWLTKDNNGGGDGEIIWDDFKTIVELFNVPKFKNKKDEGFSCQLISNALKNTRKTIFSTCSPSTNYTVPRGSV